MEEENCRESTKIKGHKTGAFIAAAVSMSVACDDCFTGYEDLATSPNKTKQRKKDVLKKFKQNRQFANAPWKYTRKRTTQFRRR